MRSMRVIAIEIQGKIIPVNLPFTCEDDDDFDEERAKALDAVIEAMNLQVGTEPQ